VVDDATLFGELWSLIDELRGPLVALTCVDRLVACLAKLFATPATRRTHPAHSRMGQSSEGVERVCNHLRSHTTESISLDDLASVAGLSKFYLLRVFRRAHGVTPHAYQMQLRLAHAWRLIVDGRSLSRATYDAGFADQSHLTRRFAAAFGLPPARYARQLAVMPGAASADVFGSGLRVAPSSAA
jgi:AraC-like DNA-binding protein